MASNFEAGVKNGVVSSYSVMTEPYVTPVKAGIVDAIERMNEDNFYHADSSTLSEAIETLTNIDKVVEESTYFYTSCSAMKTTMKNVISELEKLKEQKLAIDPALIGADCTTYNDNLEAAKMAYIKDEELATAKAYSSESPYPLEITAKGYSVEDGETIVKETYNPYYFPSDASQITKSNQTKYKKICDVITSWVSKTDYINTNGYKSHRNCRVKADQKDQILSDFKSISRELWRRKIVTNRKCDGNRSGDTRY